MQYYDETTSRIGKTTKALPAKKAEGIVARYRKKKKEGKK
jgi:hypothetical protein